MTKPNSARMHSSVREPYRTEILREAECICRDGVNAETVEPALFHLYGLLAARKGLSEFAIACLTRAVALDFSNVRYFIDLGDLLHQKGHVTRALSAYLRALTLAPSDPVIYGRLGRALVSSRRPAAAVAMYKQAMRLEPTRAETYRELGDLLCALGRLSESTEQFRIALRLNDSDVDAYRGLGHAHLHQRDWGAALDCFRQAIKLSPRRIDLHSDVGEALLRAGSIVEAIRAFRTALALDPGDVRACRALVGGLEVLALVDDASAAWCALGVALERQNRFSEAAVVYHEALARRPRNLRALFGLGSVQLQLAQPQKAIPRFEAVLALDEEHAKAHQRLGWAYALAGDLERNWDEIAWYDRRLLPNRFEQPAWDGSSLEGKTILLWGNAGLGDAVQLIRFAQLVKQLGARVLVECHRILTPLIEHMPCVDGVVATSTPLPHFDVQALLASLPRIFRTNWTNIPDDVPYLQVANDLRESWRAKLAPTTHKTIGLVWAGGNPEDGHFKSAPLATFAPLGQIPGIRFVSLQFGPRAIESLMPPAGLRVERLLDESCSAADTAALIMNLDLVITMDTMVAHLAGALGQPVWTLLRHAADWRWRLDGDTCSWYPTMRLFRQRQTGDWSEVVYRVREALEA